jgi:hypothetical protein
LTLCPLCHTTVRTVTLDEDTIIAIDPTPSLHGTIRLTDIATSTAQEAAPSPGQYRPHLDTCPGRP